ncbi:hypothetical protein HYZ82_03495 [Candidatus Nomurabacteria bacterium]|nr:hypothetical protein [Candidatus Nomurabacteria bacterium]
MKNLFRKILRRVVKPEPKSKNTAQREVSDTTNAVFERYEKSFRDLARYDREGKIEIS